MNGSIRIPLLVTILTGMGYPASRETAANLPAEQTLCIHLYNLSHAGPQTIEWATLQVTRTFLTAEIRINWEQPADSPEAHLLDFNTSGLRLAPSDERPCLVVRIMGDTLPAAYNNGALGFALPFATTGVNAEVFYNRIEEQANSTGLAAYLLLAGAMTHEMGHVLLRSPAHSAVGIMRAHWDAESWRLASFGMMGFLPEQAEQMRQGQRQFKFTAR